MPSKSKMFIYCIFSTTVILFFLIFPLQIKAQNSPAPINNSESSHTSQETTVESTIETSQESTEESSQDYIPPTPPITFDPDKDSPITTIESTEASHTESSTVETSTELVPEETTQTSETEEINESTPSSTNPQTIPHIQPGQLIVIKNNKLPHPVLIREFAKLFQKKSDVFEKYALQFTFISKRLLTPPFQKQFLSFEYQLLKWLTFSINQQLDLFY